MSILLTILKVLGILLLVLLGVALALILAVLFVPIRYRLEGAYEDMYHLRVRAGWILSILCFQYELDKETQGGRLRLFGIPIMRFGDEADDADGKEKKAAAEKEEDLKEDPKKEDLTEETALASQGKQIHSITDTEQNKASDEADIAQKQERRSGQPKEKPQKLQWKKKSGSRKKPKKKSGSKTSWIKKGKTAIQNVIAKCSRFRKLIFTEENKASVSLVLREIRYLLRHYGFRKVSGEVRFSAGDPALTGECLGFISMFPFFYRDKRTLIPDFLSEEFYIKGHGKVAGKVRMIHLIRSILHIWQDKNIRGLIHQVRK